MAVTATFSPATGVLTVTGDGLANSNTVSRTAAGALLVNGGAVAVTGGTPTVANTTLIEMFGLDGSDILTLDETSGALPAADLFGGLGNDTLTGGSGGDELFGEGDDDTLFGRGGSDLLFGGDGNDTLTGGDGDDQVSGGAGNDRLIWNPGDDSDLFEGGDGSDTAEVNGGNGAEVFTVTANGTRVRFDRIDPAPFILDIGTTESLVVNMGGGDDSFSATGNLAALLVGGIQVDGGTGNDTILGSNGADVLIGGDGNDFIDGQQGNDTAFLGAGADVFQWDPGDGSDVIEGQADTDRLQFNGSAGDEIFAIAANGARVLFTRNLGNIVMDVNDLETFTVNALGGVDTFTVNDLAGTDATGIVLDLAGTIGGTAGDAQIDTLIVNGSSGANTIDVTGSGTGFTVAGLAASIAVANSEGANDQLVVNGLGGDDSIAATTLVAGVVRLTVDGGTGNDTILASQGADTILGGDGNDTVFGDNGNDTAFLGAGNDVFEWAPGDGNDVIEGQADLDELRFAGSNASENINITPNGGRILFLRDVAAITMDLDDVEKIRFDALGGADNVIVGDLSGTDATTIELRLAASGGGGDGAADTVTVTGIGGADVVTASSSGGVVSVTGLPWAVSISGAEGANDRLTLNGLAGDDVINASALAAGLVSLTVNGGLGNDVVIGSAGGDLVNGGDGNDTALLGGGNDVFVWNPGDDNDTIEGQAGSDTLRFSGANVAENISISANGGRVLFFRDIAAVTMDLNDTEVIQFAALGGADTITVNDLSGTDVTQLAIDLASVAGGVAGDAAIDTLILNASGGANSITLSGTSGALLTVTGLPASVTISQFETGGTLDRLTILGLGGNDNISATGLVPHVTTLTIDAGAGNDIVRSNGDGTYRGGDGDDMIFAGLTSALEAIDGGTGVDTLDTTTWNGFYTIDLVTGATNFSGEAFTNFENVITGNAADTIVGTGSANIISTNDGNDTLDGVGGDDILRGGGGNDVLDGGAGSDWADYVDKAAAVSVTLNGATNAMVTVGGIAEDTIRNIENVQGGSGNDVLMGDGLANELRGLGGNDNLDGGLGADTMAGGAGDDTYTVDNVGDVVVEAINGGTDLVRSSITFSLVGKQVENLTLTGSANINGTGNSLANTLTGNAGNNVLNGGLGADTMAGGAGDDTYTVDNAGDVVAEAVNDGTDLVRSSITFSLVGKQVENLTLTGSADTNGLGNSLDNTLTGNAGNNVLNGGLGADTMAGGAGEDSFTFSTALGASNIDSISGFSIADDTIQLDSTIFNTIAGLGTLSLAQFAANASGTAQDASDRIVYETDTGKLFFDSNGSAAGGSIQFALLDAGLALTNADFFMV